MSPEQQRRPSVAVVVPTMGRDSVVAAISSVLAQSYAPSEVIVVVDGERKLLDGLDLPVDPVVRVVSSRPDTGGSAARNFGCTLASADLIALLDDDDEWLPNKLEVQIDKYEAGLRAGVRYPIVACRAFYVDHRQRAVGTYPRTLIQPGQPVADYLFRRRKLRFGEAVLSSSMLLFSRQLFDLVRFEPTLRRHIDWDWLLRADALTGTQVLAVDAPLVRYLVQEPSLSTSVARGSYTSQQWIDAQRGIVTARQHSDFLLTVTAPIALTYGQWREAARIAAKARHGGGVAWTYFLAHTAMSAKRRWCDRTKR